MATEIRQFSKFLLRKSKHQLRNHSDIHEFDQGPRHRLLHKSLKFGQILALAMHLAQWLVDEWEVVTDKNCPISHEFLQNMSSCTIFVILSHLSI